MRVLPEIDIQKLPNDVRSALAHLNLELSEGLIFFSNFYYNNCIFLCINLLRFQFFIIYDSLIIKIYLQILNNSNYGIYSFFNLGDITEKGFEKKKRLLLGPYIQAQLNGGIIIF